MANLVFKFAVDQQGKFTYTPPGDWAYTHQDSLEFTSPEGPFSVALRREDYSDEGPCQSPVKGTLHATHDPATKHWVAKVNKIDDGLTEKRRHEIWKEYGFIAKYRYLVAVMRDHKVYMDDQHNGTHQC
jgi:hypothetical protein